MGPELRTCQSPHSTLECRLCDVTYRSHKAHSNDLGQHKRHCAGLCGNNSGCPKILFPVKAASVIVDFFFPRPLLKTNS